MTIDKILSVFPENGITLYQERVKSRPVSGGAHVFYDGVCAPLLV